MAGQDATVTAVRAVLTRLCKRAGLSPERLRSTEIDVSPLLELYVIRRQAQLAGTDPADAVPPVVRDLSRQLPPEHRLIVDVGLSLGLLRDAAAPDIEPHLLYAPDLGKRRQYLSDHWSQLLRATGAKGAADAPTTRQLRSRLEFDAFTVLAQRLTTASGYASVLTLPPLTGAVPDRHTGTITVVGDAVLDNICSVDHFPEANDPATGTFLDRPGGKGLNRAVAAARLGLRVRLIAAVGDDDRGRRILDHLRAEGVETDLVRVVPGATTPVAVVLVTSSGERRDIACPNERVRLTPDDLHTPDARHALAGSDAVLLTFEPPSAVVEDALDLVARESRPRLLVQPVPAIARPQRFYRRFDAIDYLIGTRGELDALAPMVPPSEPSSDGDAELARRLRILGARTVCMVEEFATSVRSDDLEIDIGRFPATLKDSPGAPAAFVAALAHRVVTRGHRADADDFVWATAAMAATQSTGAVSGAMPTVADVDRLVELAGPADVVDTEPQ
ncbi:PfkB family carbohydrate kinase [Nocardia mexicana]|uniref:Ribokinase n=1 Tax=Nocardia mexicana TaxID=279262 RepID=A0A370HDU1_9NOCA|nr:PfkB family carbohydrate kinase [Nocardia mexicana]RDI55401.1 ribokinase [Nocardia mexicana]